MMNDNQAGRQSVDGKWTQTVFDSSAEQLTEILDAFRHDSESQQQYALLDWKLRQRDSQGSYMVHETPMTIRMHVRAQGSPLVPMLPDDDCMTFVDDETVMVDETVWIEKNYESEVAETIWHFSVIYSHTFHVPVLYFSVQYLDGSPCSRDAVVAHLHQAHHQNSVEDPWDFVSVDQHPVTGTPSFFLHPCATSDWMQLLIANGSVDPHPKLLHLLSWLSMVLAAVGMAIPAKIYQHLLTQAYH
ncbi:E2-like conjugating enzyme atg10 [Mayamaea pseudoterrestris]|nr:E2-like conjugating enzyme atg10 [Mayamaea pseudoterrestris]